MERGNVLASGDGGVHSVVESNIFSRPFFLSLTVGIPFCAFKFLFGLSLVRDASHGRLWPLIAGSVLVSWAACDAAMNLGRMLFDIAGRTAPFEYCVLAQVGRSFDRPAVLLALDTLMSFGIICLMSWSQGFSRHSGIESYVWYSATTLNLISLSLVALRNEIVRTRRRGPAA